MEMDNGGQPIASPVIEFRDFINLATGECQQLLIHLEQESVCSEIVADFNKAAKAVGKSHATSGSLVKMVLLKWKEGKPLGTILSVELRTEIIR